jgi:hypothetical protein
MEFSIFCMGVYLFSYILCRLVALENMEVISLPCDGCLNAILVNRLLVFQRAEEFMRQWLKELLHSPVLLL